MISGREQGKINLFILKVIFQVQRISFVDSDERTPMFVDVEGIRKDTVVATFNVMSRYRYKGTVKNRISL